LKGEKQTENPVVRQGGENRGKKKKKKAFLKSWTNNEKPRYKGKGKGLKSAERGKNPLSGGKN